MNNPDQAQIDSDMENMQLTIQQAQKQVRLGQALERLHDNPDFQLLVMKEYLKEQTTRLGHLLSDHSMQTKQKRKPVIKEIEAIGMFLSFLRVTNQRAQMAAEAIRVNEEELQSMAEEQAE